MGNEASQSPVGHDVTTLVHSISHCMVRHAAFFAGIDRNALSELLFPRALAFVMYAVPKGGFVPGGLQALFENDLHDLLERVVHDESPCALDPGCGADPRGAACAVCLHLGHRTACPSLAPGCSRVARSFFTIMVQPTGLPLHLSPRSDMTASRYPSYTPLSGSSNGCVSEARGQARQSCGGMTDLLSIGRLVLHTRQDDRSSYSFCAKCGAK